MDIRKFYSTDKLLENEGAWVDLDDETSIKVARIGNKAFKEVWKKETAPYQHSMKNKVLSDEAGEKIMIKVVASTILLDWKGVTENGKPVDYSLENAVRMLTEYKDFRDMVIEISSDMNNFKDKEEKEAIKN